MADTHEALQKENEQLRQRIAELEQTAASHRNLVEHSHQGLVIIQNERVVFVNTAFATICGCTIEEILSFSAEDIRARIHPEERTKVWEYMHNRLLGNLAPPRYEMRILHKDGHVRWVDIFVSVIQYRGQKASQASMIDITEHKLTEIALRKEQSRFKWVVQNAEDGYVIIDEASIIHYANHHARTYLNLPSATGQEDAFPVPISFLEIINKQYHCHPEVAWVDWPHQALSYTQENATIVRYLVRPETSCSHALWFLVEVFDMSVPRQTRYLVRLRDVSEQMIRQRQMWTFHALISHKMNTPLSGLMQSLYLINEIAKKQADTATQEYAHIAMKSTNQLNVQLQRIRHFLSVSVIAQPSEACPVNHLPTIIEQVKNELQLEHVSFDDLDLVDQENLTLSKQAIAFLLRQVIENSKKFHPSKSPVIDIFVSYPSETELSIHITDDGLNLTPNQLSRVWTPYYQVEKQFSGQTEGMGLGLAIVATMLWSIGGRYYIANREPGPGIKIELVIPIRPTLFKQMHAEQCRTV